MPIYLAEVTKGNERPSPIMERRGLELKCTELTRLAPEGTALYPQVAYHLYRAVLPSFLYATATGETVSTTLKGYLFKYPIKELIPLPRPNLVVRFEKKLSSEQTEAIKELGAEVLNPKKDDIVYKFMNPKYEVLGELVKHDCKPIATTQVIPGQCNLQGFQSYILCLNIITSFLKTQHYPAFTGELPPQDSRWASLQGFIEGVGEKRKLSHENGVTKRFKGDVEMRTLEDEVADDEEQMEEDVEMIVDDIGAYDAVQIPHVQKVPMARPPQDKVPGWGSTSAMPSIGGNIFPFFQGLLLDDFQYVPRVISEFFAENLGRDRKEILHGLRNMKGGYGMFAASDSGRVLTHIFAGIRLAIQTQTQMFVHISRDHYVGFSLHGHYYTINVSGRALGPIESTDLIREASLVDEHRAALARILQIVASAKTKRKRVGVKLLRADDITSARVLANEIKRTDMSQDQRQEIEKLSSSLSFPQTFWPFTAERILEAIQLLIDDAEPAEDTPMYCAGGVLCEEDTAISIFSAFGDHGFSFRCPGGKRVEVPDTTKEDTLYVEYMDKTKKRKVTPSRTWVLAKKGIRICAEEWKTFMREKVWMNREQRSSAFKSVVFGGDTGKSFWMKLIEIMPEKEETALEDINADKRKIEGSAIGPSELDLEYFL